MNRDRVQYVSTASAEAYTVERIRRRKWDIQTVAQICELSKYARLHVKVTFRHFDVPGHYGVNRLDTIIFDWQKNTTTKESKRKESKGTHLHTVTHAHTLTIVSLEHTALFDSPKKIPLSFEFMSFTTGDTMDLIKITTQKVYLETHLSLQEHISSVHSCQNHAAALPSATAISSRSGRGDARKEKHVTQPCCSLLQKITVGERTSPHQLFTLRACGRHGATAK